jgi:hypothetical protein
MEWRAEMDARNVIQNTIRKTNEGTESGGKTSNIQCDLRQNTVNNPQPSGSCAGKAAAARGEDFNGKTSDNGHERRDHRTCTALLKLFKHDLRFNIEKIH